MKKGRGAKRGCGAAILLLVFLVCAGTAADREVPVYPGARLMTEKAPGEEPSCCDFVTHDSYEKVLSFYESALKTKPLDAKALAAKYPDLKVQVDQMMKQMPASMKVRFFILSEYGVAGKKGAELFEVSSAPSGVMFALSEKQFSSKDAHFAAEWREVMAEASGAARPKAADPARLAAALPAAPPPGFDKGEMNTDTSSGQTSVSVEYLKRTGKGAGGESGSEDKYVTVQVTITDVAGNSEFALDMSKAQRKEEKAIKVKGKYDGKESVQQNSYGCVESEKVFLVNNRYLVELRGAGICDMALLNKLVDGMGLDKLPK